MAVKDVQLKLGLPADSYPTQELLAKLSDGGRASRAPGGGTPPLHR